MSTTRGGRSGIPQSASLSEFQPLLNPQNELALTGICRGPQPFFPSHHLVGTLFLRYMPGTLRTRLRARRNAPYNSAVITETNTENKEAAYWSTPGDTSNVSTESNPIMETRFEAVKPTYEHAPEYWTFRNKHPCQITFWSTLSTYKNGLRTCVLAWSNPTRLFPV